MSDAEKEQKLKDARTIFTEEFPGVLAEAAREAWDKSGGNPDAAREAAARELEKEAGKK